MEEPDAARAESVTPPDEGAGAAPVAEAEAAEVEAAGGEAAGGEAGEVEPAGGEAAEVEPAGGEAAGAEAAGVEAGEWEARVAAVEARTDELVAVVKRQSAIIDELHADNQRLRHGEIREATAPLIRGLARLHDDLERVRATASDNPDLEYLATRVMELLGDAGVSARRPEPGTPFDPREHQAAGSAPTEQPELDRTVAQVRRAALVGEDGRVLRAADVVVHRFTPAPGGEYLATGGGGEASPADTETVP